MKLLRDIIIIGLLFGFNQGSLIAQIDPPLSESENKLGFMYGYGTQESLGLGADYQYDVIFFQAQFYRTLKKWRKTGLELLVQPQFNRTSFIFGENQFQNIQGYEIGVNVGFLLRHYLADQLLSVYMLISTGPHYASILPYSQANGFIFSDNLFMGITIKLNEKSYLDIRPGIRHLSNAGFKKPNGGINSVIISGGLMVALD